MAIITGNTPIKVSLVLMKIHFLLSNNEEKLMTHNWEFSHIKSTGYFLKVKVWIHRSWSDKDSPQNFAKFFVY